MVSLVRESGLERMVSTTSFSNMNAECGLTIQQALFVGRNPMVFEALY